MTEAAAGRKRANGEGTIYARKDGRFEGAAYVLMTDGTVRRQRVYGRTRREAFDKLAKIQQLSREGIPMPSESWTVERYLGYWLEHVVKPTSKPKTYEGYEGIVRVHLVPTLGRKRVKSVQAADVRLLLLRAGNRCRCCEEGIDAARPEKQRTCCAVGRCCGKFPGTRRLQQVHAVLRNALQSACKEEIIMRNVARLVSVPAPNYRVHRGVDVDQARRLIEESETDRFHALYVMTLYLGMRRAELLGLAWSDVDLAAGHLEITQTLQRVDGSLRLVPTKTRSSERTVPLVGLCGEVLRAHRAGRRGRRPRPTGGRTAASSSRARPARRWNRTTCAGAGTRCVSGPVCPEPDSTICGTRPCRCCSGSGYLRTSCGTSSATHTSA